MGRLSTLTIYWPPKHNFGLERLKGVRPCVTSTWTWQRVILHTRTDACPNVVSWKQELSHFLCRQILTGWDRPPVRAASSCKLHRNIRIDLCTLLTVATTQPFPKLTNHRARSFPPVCLATGSLHPTIPTLHCAACFCRLHAASSTS